MSRHLFKTLPWRLAGCLGLALLAVPAGPGREAAAQGFPFPQSQTAFAGPVGSPGAPWGWWSIGQPLVATALWVEPMGISWSPSLSAGGQALRYSLPAGSGGSAPQLATAWNWDAPRGPAGPSVLAASPFALNWSSSFILNGGVINAW